MEDFEQIHVDSPESPAPAAPAETPAAATEAPVPSPSPLPPGLYLVGTPIGNLEDITLRALRILRSATLLLAEDTRHTGLLLAHYGIKAPMLSYHKFNERAREALLVEKIRAGAAVALVSDAGMPGISDPGARAAAAVRAAGLPVTAIPGPSAVTTAIALAGCATTPSFFFEGFLDHKTAARRRRLHELDALACPVVLYESTHRILKLVDEVEEELGPDRPLFVARELTKKFEETLLLPPPALRAHYATHSRKGEFVVILLPAPLA
ncbi:MAG: 16S rRNA (cytidine(1402)-2'-O)-methyltransferase [Kiritimatiellae bacterium]|nr:16S rRNA (cytidine(1402)-2'-O)-methyltransferase [Kiritimatiellia bacterium]